VVERHEFEWDEDNTDHIARHGVEPWEAEEAILDTGGVGTAAYDVRGETRWAVLGATEAGRVLFVVLTERAGRVRVVTARDAEGKEKRRYRRG
jgi:uncharacterized DUF497 family protein